MWRSLNPAATRLHKNLHRLLQEGDCDQNFFTFFPVGLIINSSLNS
jgi:hypothetical protein